MALKTSHHERALAAAAGLVGRPRLRAGLVLTLLAACGAAPSEGETDPPNDGSTGSSAADTTGPVATTSASSSGGDGLTGTGADESTTTIGTSGTSGEGTTTTGEATLLTDATTLATTGTTGETETDTGETTDTGTGGTTGELEDCVDMRTGEVDWVCCERQEWMPAPQCTPWGPPAPPAALGDRLQRARAARGRWV